MYPRRATLRLFDFGEDTLTVDKIALASFGHLHGARRAMYSRAPNRSSNADMAPRHRRRRHIESAGSRGKAGFFSHRNERGHGF